MGRLRLSPISFHGEPNRDYVLTMNVLIAAGVAIAAAMYLHLGWPSLALFPAVLLALELALRSRFTAWLSMAIGTAVSAGVCAIGLVGLGTSVTRTHAVWWVAAALGAVVGAWLMIDAHRKLRGMAASSSSGP